MPTKQGVYIKTVDGKYKQLWSVNGGKNAVWYPEQLRLSTTMAIRRVNKDYSVKEKSWDDIFKIRIKTKDFDSLLFVDIPDMKYLSIHPAVMCLKPSQALLEYKKNLIYTYSPNGRHFGDKIKNINKELNIKVNWCYSQYKDYVVSVLNRGYEYNYIKKQVGQNIYSIKFTNLSKNHYSKFVAWIVDDLWWFEIY